MQRLPLIQAFMYKRENNLDLKIDMLNIFKTPKTLQKIAVSALIMGALLMSMDYSKFNGSLGRIHIDSWFFALGFIYFQILALSYRWLKLINVYEKKIDFAYAIKVNLMSLVANYLFITSIGGIIVRVAMSVNVGVSLIRSIAATALDRFFTILGLLLLAIIFLPILNVIVSPDLFQSTLFLIASMLGSSVVFSLFLFETPRKKIIFSHRKIAMCFQYLRKVITDGQVIGGVVTASLVGQLAYFAAVYTIMVSMGINFSMLHFLAVIPVIALVASLPIGYGGWGIREGAFVYGLGFIDVPFETAFATSIQIGIISMGGAIIAGIPILIRSRSKYNFLRAQSDDDQHTDT